MTLATYLQNVYKARDYIVEQVGGPVPGEDLITILAQKMDGADMDGMSLEAVQELVVTVAKQRNEANPKPLCSECGPGYRIGDEGCRHTIS